MDRYQDHRTWVWTAIGPVIKAVLAYDLGARPIFENYPYGSFRSMAPGRGIKYKGGPADIHRKALIEGLNILNGWERSIVMPPAPEDEIMKADGKGSGHATDKVDAVVCAACVYAHWLYQGKTTRMLGEENDGYILLA
jgi:predicted RNase H-like nuclease